MACVLHAAGSRGWDAHLPRVVSWVALREKFAAELEPLFVFNTHLDHGGRFARLMSARMLLAATRQMAGRSPFIITGDLNCDELDPVQVLTGEAEWPIVDARQASKAAHHGEWATFTGWRGEFNKVE